MYLSIDKFLPFVIDLLYACFSVNVSVYVRIWDKKVVFLFEIQRKLVGNERVKYILTSVEKLKKGL